MTQLVWNYRFTDSKNRRYMLVECFYDKNTGDIVAVAPITRTMTGDNFIHKTMSAAAKPVLCFEDFKDQLQLKLSEE